MNAPARFTWSVPIELVYQVASHRMRAQLLERQAEFACLMEPTTVVERAGGALYATVTFTNPRAPAVRVPLVVALESR